MADLENMLAKKKFFFSFRGCANKAQAKFTKQQGSIKSQRKVEKQRKSTEPKLGSLKTAELTNPQLD